MPAKGQHCSEEMKQILRELHLGKKLSDEHKRKISEAGKGRKHSEETKKKLRAKIFSAEHRRKLSEAGKGRMCTAATRTKIGFKNTGKKRTEEFKRLRSNAYKGCKGPFWHGGRSIDKSGYVLINSPGNPFHDVRNYVFEHRLVMEKHLGRYLTKEEKVHHVNGNKADNRIENLRLLANQREHVKDHLERIRLNRGIKDTKNNTYPRIYVHDHPRADYSGRVFEHIIVMEKMIGRYVSRTEIVHHINGDKSDNRPENLTLFSSRSEHMKFHFSGQYK